LCFECTHIYEFLTCTSQSAVLCTDCNASVAAMLRNEFPNIEHQHDLFHIEKRVGKKLTAKGKTAACKELMPWVKSVTNHLWWSAQTCGGEPEVLRERWISLLYHVTNQHTWDHHDFYHQCDHEPLASDEKRKKKWLRQGSPALEALRKVVMDPRLVKDIKKTTKAVHTGPLEAHHSLINKYCPKRQHFSYRSMMARTQLAVLDHNNNLRREQAHSKDGEKKFRFVFTKRSHQWVPKPVMCKKSVQWRKDLLHFIVLCKRESLITSEDHVNIDHLPQNIAKVPRPPKQDILSTFVSRFH